MKTVETINTEFIKDGELIVAVVEIKRLGNGKVVYVLMKDKETHLFHELDGLVKALNGDMSGKLFTLPKDIDTDRFLIDAQIMFS